MWYCQISESAKAFVLEFCSKELVSRSFVHTTWHAKGVCVKHQAFTKGTIKYIAFLSLAYYYQFSFVIARLSISPCGDAI
jgi:hypothetical protein